jgi:hypothetical protein
MRDRILSYFEMCQREGSSLQRGMNFRVRGRHSVILMSLRLNAPYRDRLKDGGTVLIYEGHDVPKSEASPNPKLIDQPMLLPSGRLTENGKFYEAAKKAAEGVKPPDLVRVYQKLNKGIWSDNGYFHLVDAFVEHDGTRRVFEFQLVAVDDPPSDQWAEDISSQDHRSSRIIPSTVKLEVWKRDGGRCVECGASDELHFDHIVPFSKGGTSLTAENVQLLCARHNLGKRDQIQ